MVKEKIRLSGEPSWLDNAILNYLEDYETPHGKFVRIDERIIVSPYGSRVKVSHEWLVFWALEGPNATKDVASARISDGGHFMVVDNRTAISEFPNDLELPSYDVANKCVIVHGKSAQFGRAAESGRLATVALFQHELGGGVPVIQPLQQPHNG